MSKYFPVRFDGVSLCDCEPLWKQILLVSVYEWDETPYGLTIRIGKTDLAKEFHEKCEGDCGCQHKTGPGWFVRRGQRPTQMQTQSP